MMVVFSCQINEPKGLILDMNDHFEGPFLTDNHQQASLSSLSIIETPQIPRASAAKSPNKAKTAFTAIAFMAQQQSLMINEDQRWLEVVDRCPCLLTTVNNG